MSQDWEICSVVKKLGRPLPFEFHQIGMKLPILVVCMFMC